MFQAYTAIFTRLGLEFRVVDADAGNMGGSRTQEFHVLAEVGEDELLICNKSDFAANVEVAPAVAEPSDLSGPEEELEEFATPGLRTIADLSRATGVEEKNLVKTLFYSTAEGDNKKSDFKPVAVLLRGCDEANPVKLKNILGLSNPPTLLTDQEVRQVTGAGPGSCGPVGLSIPIYVDESVAVLKNMIVGANKDDFHLKNINRDRDFKATQIADLRLARKGEICPSSGGVYQSVRGIEVGQIFSLGTKYADLMKCQFLNPAGQLVPVEMGCYGLKLIEVKG